LFSWLNEDAEGGGGRKQRRLSKGKDNKTKKKKTKERNPRPTPAYFEDQNLLQNRPPLQRLIVLSAGVVFNVLLSFTLYFTTSFYLEGLPQTTVEPGIRVTKIINKGPSDGKLQVGDVVLGMKGRSMPFDNTLTMSQRDVGEIIKNIRKSQPGASIPFNVLRNEHKIEVSLSPVANSDGVRSIGVMLTPNVASVSRERATSVGQASRQAGRELERVLGGTVEGFKSIIASVTSNTPSANGGVSGPIGVIKLGEGCI